MSDKKKDTMKAVLVHTYGGPEVLVYEDVARPEAAAGEALLRVQAAGVNPADWKTRSGPARPGAMLPMILGWDVSGTVEALGPEVTEFLEGDAVYGMIRFPQAGATYAEYVATPVAHIAYKPTTIDHIHSAAVAPACGKCISRLIQCYRLLMRETHRTRGKIVLHVAE